MSEVITIGEILVEIMRKECDVSLKETSDFVGPFPSGAPGIFADAVARLDHSSGIIGGVGKDDFGECIIDRFKKDGVDLEGVKICEEVSTGVAFVTYFPDGSRKFIYHIENSAAGMISREDVESKHFEGASAVHINGSSLLSGDRMRNACYKAVGIAKEEDLLVSLDPNLRTELRSIERSREIISPVLEVTDLITPNSSELKMITGASNEEKAVKKLLDENTGMVAVKKGSEGCEIFTESESLKCPPFEVEEVDPTGAGDAFSAAMVVGTIEDMGLHELGTFANAVGGKAVAKRGPMEGIAWRDEIGEMIKGETDL